jgi:hypothetical protein
MTTLMMRRWVCLLILVVLVDFSIQLENAGDSYPVVKSKELVNGDFEPLHTGVCLC